ncbi:hypothetical protein BS643_18030 [Pseudomonas protegens]|nr:hypothetical protein [Pseudomonas sp. Fl4BN1]OBZ19690.1 hypothetical protein BBH57_22895 [Pseudomonas protegens]NBF13167.1 hypothetical protein [Pseudomonas sp. Fl4BN1]OBZ22489.1 hypothetical protein BBH58_17150 [Pseudomonas protegens]OKK41307.1 hypothetical protein BS643_18030 [Pseudomonas protegens]OKK43380.1 hypothetical protein BS644_22800 [Pseudomonas protegens]
MEMLERLMALLPELLLTAVIGFQAFLFRQVSESRREHLELRVEIAKNYPQHNDIERAMDKLESSLRAQLDTHFSTLSQRIRNP